MRVARDGKDPSRTYRYLLESPYEMQLLEHLLTGQLAIIDVADGNVTRIGAPAMIRSVSTAPGEEQFRVATVKKPFSYYAPFQRFGATEGIWDREGKSLLTLSDRNLRETEPQPTAVTDPTPPGAWRARGDQGREGHRRQGRRRVQGGRAASRRRPIHPPIRRWTQRDPTRNPDDPGLAPAPFDPDGKREVVWRPDGKGLSYLQLEPAAKSEKAMGEKDWRNRTEGAKGEKDPRPTRRSERTA